MRLGVLLSVVFLYPTLLSAHERVDPASVGLSVSELAPLEQAISDDIAAGALGGATLSIMKDGKLVYHKAYGTRGKGASEGPMRTDDIFRIYSMSKPITSVAIMKLHEDGKLNIKDPLHKYIPEYKSTTVLVNGAKLPQQQPITIEDLLRHTSGIVYGFFGDTPTRTEYKKVNLYDPAQTNKDMALKLASLPLEHQPGTKWEYSHSTDVLGHVIEIASGQSLGEYVEATILNPLGMEDTGFHVPEDKQDRVVEPQYPGLLNPMMKSAYQSGGGGMLSTADDYLTFTSMILNGGSYKGVQILKPETVAMMTTDQLGGITPGNYNLLGQGYGFGYGFAVRTDPVAAIAGTVGDYWWGGYAGTYFWIDPAHDLIVVYMMQAPKLRAPYRPKIRGAVYRALNN
ncbi:serine hydrolase domain-containing protein [Sneathiella glossodoripedis]|uniref:serine hydrolase domain-containing protein n=1 Tax=Sneathiella glossodoripedis TaxID=418853 RepID=UPI000472D050|nr:serine hydrolase domain-containing protein [Sneathiella glossodoripedis]